MIFMELFFRWFESLRFLSYYAIAYKSVAHTDFQKEVIKVCYKLTLKFIKEIPQIFNYSWA